MKAVNLFVDYGRKTSRNNSPEIKILLVSYWKEKTKDQTREEMCLK